MGKRRVISLLMAFLLAASLLPSTAIQALASGGTVEDWCGVNDPANTLDLSLNNGNQDQIIKQVAAAGYNDTVTINVSGTVMLKNQLYNDKGATIHLKGVGSGACIKPDLNGLFSNATVMDTSKTKNYLLSFTVNQIYQSGVNVANTKDDKPFIIENLTLEGTNGSKKCALLEVDNHKVTSKDVIYQKGSMATSIPNIWFQGESVDIQGCQFLNNEGPTNAGQNTGCLYVNTTSYNNKATGNVTITGTTFSGNKGHSGGALYAYGDKTYVSIDSTCKFENNYAGQRGGAILSHATIMVDSATFSGNKSGQWGGTVYVSANEDNNNNKHYGTVVLNNVQITDSTAAASGGGVYIADNGALFLCGDSKVSGNTVPENGKDSDNNVFVQSVNSRVVCVNGFVPEENKVGISTSNPYSGKDVVISPKNVDEAAPNYRLAATHIQGYDRTYDATTKDANVKSFKYDGEGFTIVDDPTKDGMMMLQFNSNTSDVIFDFNLPGAAAVTFLNQAIGTAVTVPNVKSPQSSNGISYTFQGWYTDAEGGEKVSTPTVTTVAGTKIYYAHWSASDAGTGGGGGVGRGDMYLVYFDQNFPNGGSGLTSAIYASGEFSWTVEVDGESKTYTAKLPFALPENPVRPGYEFLGWSKNAKATTADSSIKNGWVPDQSKTTLFGVWKAEDHTLTWDANGGNGGTTTKQKFDEVIKAPDAKPTKEGYTFTGWYVDKNCTIALPGDMTVDGDRTLYAGWTAEKVIVRYYDIREGTNLVGTQEYHYGDVLKLQEGIKNTSGQTFTRWQTKAGTDAAGIQNLTSNVLTYNQGTGGDGVQSDAGYWSLDLFAVWNEKTTDYIATINWKDLSNNDGCRPQSVHLGLISSVNNREVDEATVDAIGADQQTYTFRDLPITTADTSVEKITYSVYLKGYTDCNGTYRAVKDTAASSGEIQGATSSKYDDSEYSVYRYAINNFTTGAAAQIYSGSISLDHDLITTRDDLKFTIQWDDQEDNDGMRPKAVTLVLYADGKKVKDFPLHNTGSGVVSAAPSNCTVNEKGDTWTYVFRDYQKYNKGKAIDYTIAVVNDDQNTKFNGNDYTTKYLNAENPAVGDRNGAIISRDIKLVDKTVTIKWDDDSNRDKIRPDTVAVTLYAYQWNNKKFTWEQHLVDTAPIQGDVTTDTWTYTFHNVKQYNGGQEIIYEAAITSDLNAHIEDKDNGYTTVTNGLEITASHNRETKSVPVKIEWNDNGNNDTIRPKTVILQLYADGQKLEGAKYAVPFSGDANADTWEYTFEGLPVHKNGEEGEEILYTFKVEEAVENSLYGTYISTANGQEEEITRYTASYMDKDGQTTSNFADSAYAYVRLSHGTDQGSVNLYASWHDDQNRDGKRPTSIQVDLYKQVDGVKTFIKTYTVTAGADNSWTYKITGLPLYENGHAITYLSEVSEDFRNNLKDNYNYTVSMEGPVVHLYYTPAVGYVNGHINWSDGDNNDSIRPDSVKGTLYANGKSTGQVLEFNKANNWTQTWNDVASYFNDNGTVGTPVTYTIVVETPEGYEVAYVPESTTTVDPHDIQITLSHEANTTDIPANIYWNDSSDQDGKRPDKVTVQLYADGEVVVGKTLDLTGTGNTWNGTFTGLPVYKDGQKINYTIQVKDNITSAGYTALTAGTTLYLSRDAALADMNVSFRFDDNNNADGTRPEALYLHLTANGVEINEAGYQKTVYFDTDGVKVTFKNLPVYSGEGKKIAYNATVSLDEEYGSTDYNVLTSKDITLSTSGNSDQVVVTLKRGANTSTETGNVFWFDNNNQRGNRPESIMVDIRSDAGTAVVGTYTINGTTKKVTNDKGEVVGSVEVSEWGTDNASRWTYTISGLKQNAIYSGQANKIFYYATARNAAVKNWYTIVDGETNGLDINLTHNNYVEDIPSSKQDYSVTINWLDNSNAWGYRPNSNGVDITLYANGNEYKTIHLTQANVLSGNSNGWTYTFENLPTYLNGNAVVWTAGIQDVNMYTTTINGHSDYGTITMTQSIGFDFTTNWSDSNDDDAARPASVTVYVYGDGTKVGEATLTGIGNTWTGSISDLPVWRQSGSSTPVSYTFQWDTDTANKLIDNYYTAAATKGGNAVQADTFYYVSSNNKWGDKTSGMNDLNGQYQWETTLTRNKETTTVNSTVTWDDDANRDGKRPTSIQVQLYANGEPTGDPKTLTGESDAGSWSISWEDMDVYLGGKTIQYTTKVVSVPDGYVSSVDASGTQITLTHEVEKVSVTGTVNWDDSTEIRREYNSLGMLIKTYQQINRVDVYVQLLCNGEALGDPVKIPADGYGEGDKLAGFAAYTWDDLYRYVNQGEVNEYTFRVYSDDLTALLEDGHSMSYNFETEYAPSATITHDLYDVRGSVYYLYDSSDEFLLAGVPVTAYLYNEQTKTYTAVGNTVTDENGKYELRNLPQGMLSIRATYNKDGYVYAGSKGVQLDRCDNTADLVVNRDAQADSDLYRYKASGKAFYQTDITDKSTIHSVPEGSIVLLYKVQSGDADATYVGMTTTGKDGAYSFEKLASGSYLVNVVFNYEGSTYTYDNKDAVKDGLSFAISGADTNWNNIVKQVNGTVTPGPVDPGKEDPQPPVVEPEPCVVSGNVYYSNNGVHTTEPVAGVDVYVYSAANNAEAGRTTTDENGHWTTDGLPAGDYIAVFSYSGNASRVLKFKISDADFKAGTYTAADQYFDRTTTEPVSTIRGVALDTDGNRMSALIQILNSEGEIIDFAYTDDVGAYNFTVPADFTYRVKILEVSARTSTKQAGDPDDALTSLDYYTLTGNFSIDGVAQANCTISLYKEGHPSDFDLLAATLTDSKGNYSFKVSDAGNYRIIMYKDGKIYSIHNTSVGYQEYEPTVTAAGNDKYTISGQEAFDTATLRSKVDGVVRNVATKENGTSYSFTDLAAGTYILELTKDGTTKTYYLDAPDTVIARNYYVTVAGKVLDEKGAPVLGAIVKVYDSKGKQVGDETVITNGSYIYTNLPADRYTVSIDYPVAGATLADKTTKDKDSDNKSYPDGMTEGGTWTWNINARTVRGTVKDQNGKPLPGATIVLKKDNDPDKAYGCAANEDGTWSVGVMPGNYTASAAYPFDGDHNYPSDNSSPVTVTNSDVSGIDLIITRHTVSGTVEREGDNQPVSGVKVVISYPDGTQVWTGTTDDNGKFSTPLYPDDYVIKVVSDGKTATKDIKMDADKDVTIQVGTEITLDGTVYDTDGQTPVKDGIVYYQGKTSGKVYTDQNGHYTIKLTAKNLGQYSIYAEAAGNRSETEALDVTTDTTKDLILRTVGDATHVISGAVIDNEGNRLPNATVTLVYGNDKTKTLNTSTDKDGNYRFNVPDGTYYLTVIYDDGNGNSYATNAETTIHVTGKDVSQDLTVTRSFAVNISVVDTAGNPVSGATVSYKGASTGEKTTGTDGTASALLAGGKYSFTATIGNRVSESKDVNIQGPTQIKLIVSLTGIKNDQPDNNSKDNTIRGTVLDPKGNPVEGANVLLFKFNIVTEKWEQVKDTLSDQDGKYEFKDLPEGQYRVEVRYTQSSTVTTQPNSYEIKGYAKDGNGNPYVGATVYLYKGSDLHSSVKTDQDGYYEFLNLVAGNYTVKIVPVGDSQGDKTTTIPNKIAEPSNTVIKGTVTDANGDPVEGAIVTVTDTKGGSWSMTTGANGKYSFDLPAGGDYTVTIKYLDKTDIDTDGSYKPDKEDKLAPDLIRDSITISGIVRDTDNNPIEGAQVILKKQDGTKLDETKSGADGSYKFENKDPGVYIIEVIVGTNKQDYTVDTNEPKKDDPENPSKPDEQKISIAGTVVTDHKKTLAGAVITVTNKDTGTSSKLIADQDGRFNTGDLEKGRYEIIAEYTHKYGTNQSDPMVITSTQKDAVLVIILSYTKDVNGDGKPETVYAGKDDTFDTPDDFYPADPDKDGKDDPIYAGKDGKPGTKDDYYEKDVNDDGKKEPVYVGEDRIPGTSDDYYLTDPDKDGKDDPIYAGKDGLPGTKDDFYEKDANGDGKKDQIFVGEDKKPGTKDDWYEGDPDKDGKKEQIFVGEDTKPGTKDDWYEKDGEKHPMDIVEINFNANGGTVNGKSVDTIAKAELRGLPTASRSNYTFQGWYSEAAGGKKLSEADMRAFAVTTTVYAHWTESTSGGGGIGGGGGGAGGGGVVTPPSTGDITVTIEGTTGAVISPSGDQKVKKGSDLTIKISAEDKYILKDVVVDGKSQGPVESFTLKNITEEHKISVVAVPKTMLTDVHISYVSGYPDGNVRPDANITRAEVAMIFYRLLNDQTRNDYNQTSASFTDVAHGSWFESAVATLAKLGIISGYPDGSFKPNANITRAEFATIASRFDKLAEGGKTFTDVANTHWAYKFISSASAKGWINGYEDGTFRPDRAITRAETMTLVNRVLGRDTIKLDSLLKDMKKWPDNADTSKWFYLAVQEATNAHDSEMKNGVETWTQLTGK